MRSTARRATIVVSMATCTILGVVPSGVAAEQESAHGYTTATLRFHRDDDAIIGEQTESVPQGNVTCDATVHNPHFSKGTGGVIAKTDIACHGDIPVDVRLHGSLRGLAGDPPPSPPVAGPMREVTNSDQVQTVPPNGSMRYYTPMLGAPPIPGGRWFENNVQGQIVAPFVGIDMPASSNRVWA